MADSVLPGLKPYQPNQRMRPPQDAMVRSWGNMGTPLSRLNRRTRRGSSAMAPARAMKPPMVEDKAIKDWVTHLPRKYYQRVRVPRLPGAKGGKTFWV